MRSNIADIRKEYIRAEIDVSTLLSNPIEQFRIWLDEAILSLINEPTAFNLSTVSEDKPRSRIVLLKEVNEVGFVFFTNYNSSKGAEIEKNPYVSMNFFWPELERQIRIEGFAQKVSEEDSDIYFNTRPLGSKIGAWASPQSSKIESRSLLEENVEKYSKLFNNKIERPSCWGGYCIVPHQIEFWQGRASRLHDRIVYEKENEIWVKARLAP